MFPDKESLRSGLDRSRRRNNPGMIASFETYLRNLDNMYRKELVECTGQRENWHSSFYRAFRCVVNENDTKGILVMLTSHTRNIMRKPR